MVTWVYILRPKVVKLDSSFNFFIDTRNGTDVSSGLFHQTMQYWFDELVEAGRGRVHINFMTLRR